MNLIYIPIIIWIALVVILLGLLAWWYPFNPKWDKNNPNPYEKETMAMPRGLLRGILTLTILFTVVLIEVYALRENIAFEVFESKLILQLLEGFQLVLAFYFGGKVLHHVTSVDKQKARETNESVKEVQKTRQAEAMGQIVQPEKDPFYNAEARG